MVVAKRAGIPIMADLPSCSACGGLEGMLQRFAAHRVSIERLTGYSDGDGAGLDAVVRRVAKATKEAGV